MSEPKRAPKLHASTWAWLHILLLLLGGLALTAGYWMVMMRSRKAVIIYQRSLHTSRPTSNATRLQVDPVTLRLDPSMTPIRVIITTDYRYPVTRPTREYHGPILSLKAGSKVVFNQSLEQNAGRNAHEHIARSPQIAVDHSEAYTIDISPQNAIPISALSLTVKGKYPTMNYAWPIIGGILILCAILRFMQVFGWSGTNWKRKLKNSADTVFHPIGGADDK